MAQRINVETASSVISGFYDAAYGRANWADALKPLTETLHSARSCIFHLRASGCNAISDVEDQELNSRQSVEMLMRDPLGAAYGRARPGEVYRREALIDEEALRNRPLWTDLFRARDMARDLIFRIPVSGPDEFWTAQIHRGQGQGDFSEEEIAFFRLCVAHVARAGEIGSLLKQRQSLASAFADLPVGMVLLDEAGLPTSFNARAETLLGRPNAPLTLRGNLLHCQDPKHLRSFDRLLRSVLARDGTQPGGSLVLGLGTPQQMVATIAPYQTSGLFGTPASRQAVVLLRAKGPFDPRRAVEQVGGLLDLTPSEARLGLALASGATLRHAAESCQITLKTARTYLERIYRKTDIGQQSQLVALIKSVESLD